MITWLANLGEDEHTNANDNNDDETQRSCSVSDEMLAKNRNLHFFVP